MPRKSAEEELHALHKEVQEILKKIKENKKLELPPEEEKKIEANALLATLNQALT